MMLTRHRRITTTSALVLAAGLTLGACGSTAYDTNQPNAGPKSAAASSVIDPCAILSQGEFDRLLGTTATVQGAAVAQFRGRTCTWEFSEAPGGILDTGTLAIDAFKGNEFFVPGTIGDPLAAVGDQAQEDLDHGTVVLRKGEDVVQVHVLSASRRDRTLPLAQAVAEALD